MLLQPEFDQLFSPEDKLALLISALCHDVDHDGFTNSFHVNSESQLAITYNDSSPQENHHCSVTFTIASNSACNFFASLPPQQRRRLRTRLIQLILATDMTNHTAITRAMLAHPTTYNAESEDDIALLAKAILHAVDIGNVVRKFDVALLFSERIHKEFREQISEERRLGLPVSPHMDVSDNHGKVKMELNFMQLIAKPLWARLAEIAPGLNMRI